MERARHKRERHSQGETKMSLAMRPNVLIEVKANSRRAKKILQDLLKSCEDRWAFLVGYTLQDDKLRIQGDFSLIRHEIFNEVIKKHTPRQMKSLTWRIIQ